MISLACTNKPQAITRLSNACYRLTNKSVRFLEVATETTVGDAQHEY